MSSVDMKDEYVKAAVASRNEWLENILLSLNRCGINLQRDVDVEIHPLVVTRVFVFGNPVFEWRMKIA